MTCPQYQDRMSRLLDGCPDPDLELHLKQCPDCRAEFELHTALIASMQREANSFSADPNLGRKIRQQLDSQTKRRRQHRLYALAALLLLGIGIGIYVFQERRDPPPPTPVVAVNLPGSGSLLAWTVLVEDLGKQVDQNLEQMKIKVE